MSGGFERVMECTLVDEEVIRLILRPELPFYPDQVSVKLAPRGVEITLREGGKHISFVITEDEMEDPTSLLRGSIVNLIEFPHTDQDPSRDTLIEITPSSR